LKLQAVYIFKGNKLDLPIIVSSHKGSFQEKALINSGVMESFVDQEIVKRLKLRTWQLEASINVRNINGTKNIGGKITSYLNQIVSQGNRKIRERFYITNLREDRIILEYPWLCDFNPQINWPNYKLIRLGVHFNMTFEDKFMQLQRQPRGELQIHETLTTNNVTNLNPSGPSMKKPLGIQHKPDPDPEEEAKKVVPE